MKHHIIIKFNKNTDKEILIPEIKNYFNSLNIEGIKKIEVFTSSNNLSNRFDMMVKIDINKEALNDLEKTDFKQKYKDYISRITIFDC